MPTDKNNRNRHKQNNDNKGHSHAHYDVIDTILVKRFVVVIRHFR